MNTQRLLAPLSRTSPLPTSHLPSLARPHSLRTISTFTPDRSIQLFPPSCTRSSSSPYPYPYSSFPPSSSTSTSTSTSTSNRSRIGPKRLLNYSLAFSLPFSFFGLFGGGGESGNVKGDLSSDTLTSTTSSTTSSGSGDGGGGTGTEITSKSSTLSRPGNAFVQRQQASTLFFVSVREAGRKGWQGWIGYFRDQSFDCIDANLDFEYRGGVVNGKSDKDAQAKEEESRIFAEELRSQIRLSSLQRSPLVFIRASSPSSLFGSPSTPSPISILHAHVTSRPAIAGLIIVEGKAGEATEEEGAETMLQEMKSKLGGRVLVVEDGEQGMREGERWMVEKGF